MPLQRLLCRLLAGALLWACVAGAQQSPPSNHVVLITEENTSFEQVIGNPDMPYFNQLAQQYGLALQYYATCHNSITALMYLTAGAPVTENDDTTLTFNLDNLVRHLLAQGKTWKSYAEDLPYVGFLGLYSGEYVKRHNPLAYFSDVAYSDTQRLNLVPLDPYLAQDLANDTLPNYSYITPNLLHDQHDGTARQADQWLQNHVPAILANPSFQQDGLLFIVFDEGNLNPVDSRGGGGRVAVVVIGPQALHGSRSSTVYNHQSMLLTVCNALGLPRCPNTAQSAVPMRDFWGNSPVVQIQTPVPNQIVGSAGFELMADLATTQYPASALIAYVDDNIVARASGGQMDTQLSLPVGSHHLVVNGWDSKGNVYKSGEMINVIQSYACPPPGGDPSVTLCLPSGNPAVPLQFMLNAFATDTHRPIVAMQVYVDDNSVYKIDWNQLSTVLNLTSGQHHIVVNAWDSVGNVYKAGQYVNAQ